MDAARIDTLVKSLTTGSSRRRVLRGLSAALVVAASRLPEGADARHPHPKNSHHHNKNNKQSKNKKQRKNGQEPVTQTPEETPPVSPPTRDLVTTADAFCPTGGGSIAGFTGARRFAQTFVALRSGQLTSASVNMTINAEGNDFELEIRGVDGAGKLAAVLASTGVSDVPKTSIGDPPRTITGTFATPAEVVAGQRYALSVTVAPNQGFAIEVEQGNPCADGIFFVDSFGNGTFQPQGTVDLVYATFVTA